MKAVKALSRLLCYFSRVLSIFYFAAATLSLLALTTGMGLNIRDGGKYFQVYYPFTSIGFLNGDYNITYIIFFFLAPLSLYGLFFLLLSNVFKVFFQPKLFTSYGVKHLRLFYLANCIIPGVMVLLTSFFAEVETEAIAIVVLHFTLGVFAYFFSAIFNQGVQLQKEQDLYI